MVGTRTAKIFKNGASQAVRLPADFRFQGDEIFATRDSETGDVLLSAQPAAQTWAHFFEFVHSIDVPEDFMSERPLNVIPVERDLFGEVE